MENKNEINIKEAYRAKLTKGWRELVDGWSLDEKIVEKIKKTAAAAACYQSLMSEEDEDYMLEKAFKEGCEHGYKKAMREAGFDERSGSGSRGSYREGFEEKIEKLKRMYR